MENQEITNKPRKSTFLLILFLFLLFNAAHLFRTSINTLYFTEDISGDYSSVQATVKELKTDRGDHAKEDLKLIPVFSFIYQEEEVIMNAPELSFAQVAQNRQPYKQGENYTLWVHKRWGKLMVPPLMGPKELGRSQLLISVIFLLFAVAIWVLRNKLGTKSLR